MGLKEELLRLLQRQARDREQGAGQIARDGRLPAPRAGKIPVT
jgi:hypothetical protein